MTTVDEVAVAVGESPAGPPPVTGPNAGPAGEHVWASLPQEARVVVTAAANVAPELAGVLAEVRKWTARAEELTRQWRKLQAAAQGRAADVRARLVDDPAAAAELVEARAAAADVEAAKEDFRKARRAAQQRAYGVYTAAADQIFRTLQDKCGEYVRRVAAVPELPPQVWGATNPEKTMVEAGRIEDWGVLVEGQVMWSRLHEVADLLRPQVGAESFRMATGAPRMALRFRNWELAASDGQQGPYRRLKPPLRLRYAIENGWDPGIWRPADVDNRPAKRSSFGARVRDALTFRPR
jgi:hypothetical protein